MAQREPGLDEVMSDETLERFITGHPPVLEEPPARRTWPAVLLAGSIASTVSVLIGMLIVDYVDILAVLFVVCCIITATTAIYWLNGRDVDPAARD